MTIPSPTPQNGRDDLLTVPEVAALLKVHKATVQRWSRERGLPAVKIGKEYRIRRSDLEAWYEELRAARQSQRA